MIQRHILTILILGSLAFSTQAQRGYVTIGKKDSLYSKVLNENRKLSVYVPEGTSKYPVVYLFDEEGNFEHTVSTIKQLSTSGNQFWSQMIIVGISNTDRTRDLTPSHVESFKNSGGGKMFMEFMKNELIPYIDNKYPTKPYRTLIGHSFGGLMAVYAMTNYSSLFNNFISLDPSLWWDNGNFLKLSIEKIKQGNFENKSLYISASNPEVDNLDLNGLEKDTSPYTNHIRAIIRFSKEIKLNEQDKLSFKWKYFESENHVSIPLISTYDAMHFAFSWYRFENPYQFFDTLLSAKKLVEKINSHFDLLTKKFGYKVLPPENWINQYGYELMWEKMYDKSFAFFDMNIRNYPESPNVYDSMGDYFLTRNDKNKALEFFEKSQKIKRTEVTTQKIKKLKEG